MPSQRMLGTLVFLLIISVCVAIPALAFQNEPDGFRGIKWGTNLSELPDMVLTEDVGDEKFYTRKSDKMKIGEADIGRISYRFYKNRFCGVLVGFTGSSNFTKLKAVLFDQYGQPEQTNQFMEKYSWLGGSVVIALHYNEISKTGNIFYGFIPIRQEEEMDDKQKAKKGAKDL